jgi:hypothetical protein
MQPVTKGLNTSETKVHANWVPLPSLAAMGGKQVFSYNLQWDRGTNAAAWYDVLGNTPSSLALTVELTQDIVGGVKYNFRVRSQNIHGLGAFSTVFGIKAAQRPDSMQALTTTIDGTSGGVIFSWIKPHDGFQDLTSYTVLI